MAAVKLNSRFCESVKAVEGIQLSFPDALVRGLELRISGDGRKTCSFRYRTRTGRQGRITIGVYSESFELEQARKAATRARVVVDDGGDPATPCARLRSRPEPSRSRRIVRVNSILPDGLPK
jgi:hypothetical protein